MIAERLERVNGHFHKPRVVGVTLVVPLITTFAHHRYDEVTSKPVLSATPAVHVCDMCFPVLPGPLNLKSIGHDFLP